MSEIHIYYSYIINVVCSVGEINLSVSLVSILLLVLCLLYFFLSVPFV